MSNPLPAAVKAVMKASGVVAPFCLLEIQTLSGNRYYWADAQIDAPSLLAVVYAAPPVVTVGPVGDPIVSHPQ